MVKTRRVATTARRVTVSARRTFTVVAAVLTTAITRTPVVIVARLVARAIVAPAVLAVVARTLARALSRAIGVISAALVTATVVARGRPVPGIAATAFLKGVNSPAWRVTTHLDFQLDGHSVDLGSV